MNRRDFLRMGVAAAAATPAAFLVGKYGAPGGAGGMVCGHDFNQHPEQVGVRFIFTTATGPVWCEAVLGDHVATVEESLVEYLGHWDGGPARLALPPGRPE